jgi:hypothetical protein
LLDSGLPIARHSAEEQRMRSGSALAAGLLLLSVACLPRGPVVDTGPKPEGVGGTIAGRVSTGDGTTPVSARKVTAVNTASGARFEASTATNGGYTIKVPAGTYRLEVEMRGGETVSKQPDTTEVNVGDLDPDRDFVLTIRPPA